MSAGIPFVRLTAFAALVVLFLSALGWLAASGATAAGPTTSATEPAIPDVVVLDQLSKTEKLFGPVPFDHKSHAEMSRMQGGCTTCHHRQPDVTTQKVDLSARGSVSARQQEDAGKHPACRTCHPPQRDDMRQPGLKGAYHRQCLNCHREWAHANNCSVCHLPLGKNAVASKPVTRDDILSKMHPPMQEPEVHAFKTRLTPADGGNVLFRHKEHIETYGVKCVTCHKSEDSCARCHDNNAAANLAQTRAHPNLDLTWDQAHRQCSTCHRREENRCTTCHFKDGQSAPLPFAHASTGQVLDADHVKLNCVQCHASWVNSSVLTCNTAGCHTKSTVAISFPARRPGPFSKRPTSGPATRPVDRAGAPASAGGGGVLAAPGRGGS